MKNFLSKIGLAMAACCLLSFSGCVPLESNIENLILPPKLNDLQMQVDAALRSAIGDAFTLKYPQTGAYKSAFNFIDLNDDQVEEAIVFFKTDEKNIQMATLYQSETGWQVSDILSGINFFTEVDFIDFRPIGNENRLLVGWKTTGEDLNLMYIYNVESTMQSSISLTLDKRWEYSKLFFTEDKQNNIIMLIGPDNYNNNPAYISLVGNDNDNTLALLDSVDLPINIKSFENITYGKINQTENGLVVDCKLNNGNFCTIGLTYNQEKLAFPMNISDMIYQTVRNQAIMSEDINKDGIIDIPSKMIPAGYENNTDNTIFFTSYKNFANNNVIPVQNAYINTDKNFRFNFPARWSKIPVSIYIQPDGNEFIFFSNYNDDIYDHSNELARIKHYPAIDSIDKLDTQRFFTIVEKGTSVYLASVPTVGRDEHSLTPNEVRQLFSLLK